MRWTTSAGKPQAEFLERLDARGIQPLHRVIDLGDGKRVTTICDVEGNTIRLIQLEAR